MTKNIFRILCLLVLLSYRYGLEAELPPSKSPYNLEEQISSCVLKTKQIRIPAYPRAYNPSIVKWKDRYLMSFRIDNKRYEWIQQIGLVWLDRNFNPVGKAQILNTRVNNPLIPSKSQDARLFVLNGLLYIVYNDNEENTNDFGSYRYMYVSNVTWKNNTFYVNPIAIRNFPSYTSSFAKIEKCEKNWVPFDYNGNLLFAYSLNPMRIYQPDLPNESSEEIYQSVFTSLQEPDPIWEWDNFRGGTPAVKNGDEYLAFFHSRQKEPFKQDHWLMGAYTFSSEPPFQITRISSKPIIGKGFYKDKNKIIYPSGIIVHEDFVWVSYGKNDGEMWVAKIDKATLLESLVIVE